MDSQVEILDASNTTEARRSFIHQVLTELGIKVIFLECLYGEEVDQVDTHVSELRLTIPEYDVNVSDEDALSDFKVPPPAPPPADPPGPHQQLPAGLCDPVQGGAPGLGLHPDL